MRYEVQTYTLCAGWVNIWTDNDNEPVTFDRYEAAQAGLADYLAALAFAVKLGHLDDFNPEDHRIQKVPV
jgi:hypothetical protein